MVTLAEFERGQGDIVFSWLAQQVKGGRAGYSRQDIASAIRIRAIEPKNISQEDTPLCGPAAFMYCVVDHHPDAYTQYVVDLLTAGKGKLGALSVEASPSCMNEATPIVPGKIHPVDWVALASLRNLSAKDADFEGITAPITLQKWFRATGWFSKGVANSTNLFMTKDLENLLDANNRRNDGYVCLLINAGVIKTGNVGRTVIPNHWIALRSYKKPDLMMFGNAPAPHPGMLQYQQPEYDPERYAQPAQRLTGEEDKQINFEIYSWGKEIPINKEVQLLTVGQFLHSYYGFVSATP